MRSFLCVSFVFAIAAGLVPSGCSRDESVPPPESATGTEPVVTGTPSADAEVVWQPPSPVDAEDDPDRPRALPKTGEVAGWIKTKPIRLTPIAEAKTFNSSSGSEISLTTFELRKVARCGYEHEHCQAEVLLIECATASDAFGVFSLLTEGSGMELAADKSIRCFDRASGTYSGWQGRTYVRVQLSEGNGEQAAQAGTALTGRILFSLPTAEPPMLMQMVPAQERQDVRFWLVRRTAALQQTPVSTFKQFDPHRMDARLGLDGHATLSVAAIRVAPGEPDNLIWLLECADEAEAVKAYERYQAALVSPANRLDSDTIVTEPIGHLLLGSWTAGQESIQNLLPQLKKVVGQ